MSNYTCLILTHIDKKSGQILSPHLDLLKLNNPDLETHLIIGEDDCRGARYNWKNGDKPLRDWWSKNGSLIKTKHIAVVEWDTLVNRPFPEFDNQFDLLGGQFFREPKRMRNQWIQKKTSDKDWHQDNWWWWKEIPKLGLSEKESAVGLVSFGCYLMNREVLDAVCLEKWDNIYSKDIQNELRFPTVASVEGFRIGQITLPYVHHSKMEFCGKKEIYHPIKKQFSH